jgi:hypothetical protein
MEQDFIDFQKHGCQCGDPSPNSQGDEFDIRSDCGSLFQLGMTDAPDILRKSMERFLIGNVI